MKPHDLENNEAAAGVALQCFSAATQLPAFITPLRRPVLRSILLNNNNNNDNDNVDN